MGQIDGSADVRRRAVLMGGAAAAAFGVTRAKAEPPIVLVHGSWHGGWCWWRVEARLKAARRPQFSERWRKKAVQKSERLAVVPVLMDARALGIVDPADIAWVDRRLTPHPLATYDEKLQFDEAVLGELPRTFIHCTGFNGFGPAAERARKQGMELKTLGCGHDAMLAAPEELAQMLHGSS